MKISTDELKLLLARISEEDDDAFKKLFFIYNEKLISFAYWYVGTNHIAEDVVSEVFFNIWNKRHKLADINNFETYLYSSVKNGCYNILNSGYRRKVSPIDDADLEVFIDFETPLSQAHDKQVKDAIERAINNLPERCKLIFKMAKEDNLKYKDIATILDISVKTVEAQISIAMRKLGEELRPFSSD